MYAAGSEDVGAGVRDDEGVGAGRARGPRDHAEIARLLDPLRDHDQRVRRQPQRFEIVPVLARDGRDTAERAVATGKPGERGLADRGEIRARRPGGLQDRHVARPHPGRGEEDIDGSPVGPDRLLEQPESLDHEEITAQALTVAEQPCRRLDPRIRRAGNVVDGWLIASHGCGPSSEA